MVYRNKVINEIGKNIENGILVLMGNIIPMHKVI